jgi:hypothetical protein
MSASIVAGDNAGNGPDVSGTLTLLYPNLIQNISGAHIVFGTDRNDLDADSLTRRSIFGKSPNVGPLQNNGGLTQTHALLPGSPAIDQIPSVLFEFPSVNYADFICHSQLCGTDQRGVSRPQGGGIDIGAYEYAPPP